MNPLVQLDPGLFIWTIITFLVLFFALAKFAWKPLLKMLKDREDMIRDSLDDAEKAKVELERLSEESEAIMAKARSEAQSILAEGKTAAEKVKDDIIAKSKEQANKIREDAENQIQVEKE
ncbi:MAG TPA: ATP synthase F0 subunit B, partial [Candidatus Marinimicrobia bacterium]|nr:ATP synthase F0 subunit B [Candidatus Neomarinimicrobiota bacterium]